MSLSSAACDYSDDWFIPFVGDDVVLSVPVILKNKAALDTQKGASLDLKCVRMRLAAGLRPPDPLGKLERSPDPLAAIGRGCLLLKGREGNGKREGR